MKQTGGPSTVPAASAPIRLRRSASLAHGGPHAQLPPAEPTPSYAAYLSGKQPLIGLHAPSSDAPPRDPSGRPMLALRTVNRGEYMKIPAAREDGGFDALDLDQVAHFLRSAGGEEHPMDPRTLGLVYAVQVHFAAPEVRVVSGYRTPKPHSHSNHGKGRAMDVIVPGVSDEDVARFARARGFVGVGVYPRSQFVHLDVRPRSYFWVDYSGPRVKNKEHGILGDVAARSDAEALARGEPAVEPFQIGCDVDAALRSHGAAAALPEPDDDDEDEGAK